MANALYAKGRQGFCNGVFDLSADAIKAVLVKSTYSPNLSTHQYLSDLGANTLGTAVALTFTSDTAGTYKASSPVFSNVPAGTVGYVAIYKDTGVAGTSPLIALIDTATGLPVTSTGSSFSITVTWDAAGIFTL